NPPDAAVINYYQRQRHLFGKMKLEILDSSGRVIDELPASKRPGLNRVTWPMRAKPPRVPPGAQVSSAGTRGPRLVPGVYTVRLTKRGKVSETKLTLGLDRRAKFSETDRKAQFDAAMRVVALFGDESALMDRILALRKALAQSGAAFPESDPLGKNISDFDGKVDAVRKKIVATTEGGATTGEERWREHTDQLSGAIARYEGKPGAYQIAYNDARKLAAIMFTDMVGYSAVMERNEALALALLEDYRRLLRSIFPKHQGSEIKTIGDGFLLEFSSALAAVQCGTEIQEGIAKRNSANPQQGTFQVRIGIHAGDVVRRDNDVIGDGVNIAAR